MTKVEDHKKTQVRKGHVLTAPEWNMEQLNVAVKEPLKHDVNVNIVLHFANIQIQRW